MRHVDETKTVETSSGLLSYHYKYSLLHCITILNYLSGTKRSNPGSWRPTPFKKKCRPKSLNGYLRDTDGL
jgi:hypothetical protein